MGYSIQHVEDVQHVNIFIAFLHAKGKLDHYQMGNFGGEFLPALRLSMTIVMENPKHGN